MAVLYALSLSFSFLSFYYVVTPRIVLSRKFSSRVCANLPFKTRCSLDRDKYCMCMYIRVRVCVCFTVIMSSLQSSAVFIHFYKELLYHLLTRDRLISVIATRIIVYCSFYLFLSRYAHIKGASVTVYAKWRAVIFYNDMQKYATKLRRFAFAPQLVADRVLLIFGISSRQGPVLLAVVTLER